MVSLVDLTFLFLYYSHLDFVLYVISNYQHHLSHTGGSHLMIYQEGLAIGYYPFSLTRFSFVKSHFQFQKYLDLLQVSYLQNLFDLNHPKHSLDQLWYLNNLIDLLLDVMNQAYHQSQGSIRYPIQWTHLYFEFILPTRHLSLFLISQVLELMLPHSCFLDVERVHSFINNLF